MFDTFVNVSASETMDYKLSLSWPPGHSAHAWEGFCLARGPAEACRDRMLVPLSQARSHTRVADSIPGQGACRRQLISVPRINVALSPLSLGIDKSISSGED